MLTGFWELNAFKRQRFAVISQKVNKQITFGKAANVGNR
jgi:hypothetical protein